MKIDKRVSSTAFACLNKQHVLVKATLKKDASASEAAEYPTNTKKDMEQLYTAIRSLLDTNQSDRKLSANDRSGNFGNPEVIKDKDWLKTLLTLSYYENEADFNADTHVQMSVKCIGIMLDNMPLKGATDGDSDEVGGGGGGSGESDTRLKLSSEEEQEPAKPAGKGYIDCTKYLELNGEHYLIQPFARNVFTDVVFQSSPDRVFHKLRSCLCILCDQKRVYPELEGPKMSLKMMARKTGVGLFISNRLPDAKVDVKWEDPTGLMENCRRTQRNDEVPYINRIITARLMIGEAVSEPLRSGREAVSSELKLKSGSGSDDEEEW